jgi:hypothetical protein
MRRDDGENERLRALIEGAPIGSNGSDAASEPVVEPMERTQ